MSKLSFNFVKVVTNELLTEINDVDRCVVLLDKIIQFQILRQTSVLHSADEELGTVVATVDPGERNGGYELVLDKS